ncbi:hypothetical protein [Marilutibacter chinensis]|uniref:DUF2306 domain-containing protein n=1 Tax=Marilutibacter chinensis TaxID=2912247 RepID=A0ABS9HVX8_9GAMM|nr:hypothetical protein [Lysobacter chinensis]MCF7222863.1 hypothetical protein [Lysobacter chinensis]
MSVLPSRGGPERPLYTRAAWLALLVVFVGFARTYYLKLAFDPRPLTLLVHLHGLVMSGWFVLFAVQAVLVERRRVDLHRRLGIVGAMLAVAVLVVGTATAIAAARLGRAPPGPPPEVFLAVPLGDMLLFAIFVGIGLAFRRRRDVHKRMMLLSCVAMLTPGLARIPLQGWTQLGLPAYFIATCAIVLGCVAWDTARNRRLHPALGWGAALVVVSWPARLALTSTGAWQWFVRTVVG